MQNTIQSSKKTLNDLIINTYNEYSLDTTETKEYSKTLINILKRHNYWPALQVKKFKGQKNIILLHNSYIREDIEEFKELYEQCRSVILDFEAELDKIVISYSNSIPYRIKREEYVNDNNDKISEAYNGTMITCYYYNNKWHFGTTSCPDINSSWFSHPTKTHGVMLDEVLSKYLNISQENARESFTNYLDKKLSYMFVLVHHENKHIIDYTSILSENYMELLHIDSKEMGTLKDINIDNQPLITLGIKYPRLFNNQKEADEYMNSNLTYGYIVKRELQNGTKSLAKISPEEINYKEETDPCNPNPWMNILSTYMKNRMDYHINDYIRDYNPTIEKLVDNNGKEIDPTYLIHTSICTIKDIIYKLYTATTTYNSKRNMFKMNKEIDKHFAPLIRFHLGRLRKRQITVYTEKIKPKDIYYYLCHCLKANDIRRLLQLLTTTSDYEITDRSMMCLVILNGLLN